MKKWLNIVPVSILPLFLAFAVAAASHGNDFKTVMSKADGLVRKRASKAALPLYRQAVKLNPGSAEAHAGLGWVLYDTGERQQGFKEVRRAVALNPKSALAHHYLATMLWTSGQEQQAADEFRLEYAIDPKRHCHCGVIEHLLKKYPPRTRPANQ